MSKIGKKNVIKYIKEQNLFFALFIFLYNSILERKVITK